MTPEVLVERIEPEARPRLLAAIRGTPHSHLEVIDGDGVRWGGPIHRFRVP